MRATTYCTKDYLDSRAGYYALAMARQCKNIDEKGLNGIFLEMAEKVDAVANKYGALLLVALLIGSRRTSYTPSSIDVVHG